MFRHSEQLLPSKRKFVYFRIKSVFLPNHTKQHADLIAMNGFKKV